MKKIAHRGACSIEPENTLAAFEKAIELGADMIEFDVRRCKSRELIVVHDARVNNCSDGVGYVGDMTLDEIKNLNAGNGQKIPTLKETLDLIDHRAQVNIELKDPDLIDDVAEIIKFYVKNKGWTFNDFLISSSDHHQLKKSKQLIPQVPTGPIISCIPHGYSQFVEAIDPNVIVIYHELVNATFVDDIHRRGLYVYAYTVNHPDDIKRMKDLEVDGIITDHCNRL